MRARVPAALIKLWGRWRSNAVDRYLEEAALENAEEAIAQTMVTSEQRMKEEEERFTFDDEILQSSTDLLREWLPEQQEEVEQFLRDASNDEKKQWRRLLGEGKAKAKAKAKAKIKAKAKPKGRPKREPGPPERTTGVPSPTPAAGLRPAATAPTLRTSETSSSSGPAATTYRRLRQRSKGRIQWVKKEGMAFGNISGGIGRSQVGSSHARLPLPATAAERTAASHRTRRLPCTRSDEQPYAALGVPPLGESDARRSHPVIHSTLSTCKRTCRRDPLSQPQRLNLHL